MTRWFDKVFSEEHTQYVFSHSIFNSLKQTKNMKKITTLLRLLTSLCFVTLLCFCTTNQTNAQVLTQIPTPKVEITKLYPNPTAPSAPVTIRLISDVSDIEYQFELTDIIGTRSLLSESENTAPVSYTLNKGENEHTVVLPKHLPSGYYFILVVIHGHAVAIRKISIDASK